MPDQDNQDRANKPEFGPDFKAQVNSRSVDDDGVSPQNPHVHAKRHHVESPPNRFPHFKEQCDDREISPNPSSPGTVESAHLSTPPLRPSSSGPAVFAPTALGEQSLIPESTPNTMPESSPDTNDSPHQTSSCNNDENLIEARIVDADVLGVAEVVDMRKLRRKRLVLLIVALAVVTAVVAAVAVTGGGGSDRDESTVVPTPEPTGPGRNDECEDARLIKTDGLVHSDTLVNATIETDTILCGTGKSSEIVPDAPRGRWYSFDGDGLSPATLELCVTAGNVSKPLILIGRCGELECLGGLNVEKSLANQDCLVEYRASFLTENRNYWFLVYADDARNGEDSIAEEFDLRLFTNDVCDGAYPLSRSSDTTGPIRISTAHGKGFASSDENSCVSEMAATYPGVYFVLRGTGGEMEVAACAENPSTKTEVSVFSGNSTCQNMVCNDTMVVEAERDCGPSSAATWLSKEDLNYLVRVSTDHASDNVTLKVQSRRDSCEAALALEIDTVVSGSNIGAANQTTFDGCLGYPAENLGPGVWFSVEGNGRELEATTCVADPNTMQFETEFDSALLVFTSKEESCNDLECYLVNDDVHNCVSLSRVHWLSEKGKKYFILVFGFNGAEGNFALTVRTYNDGCENALGPLALGSITYGSVMNASVDEIGACGGAPKPGFPGVWYRVVGNGGYLLATTCTSNSRFNGNYDSDITLLSGTCTNLTCIDGNEDGTNRCGEEAAVSWQSEEGVEYFILVHGGEAVDQEPDFSLEFRETLNDACEFAIGPIVPNSTSKLTGSTENALNSVVGACGEASEATSPGLWYSVEPVFGLVLAKVCRSANDEEPIAFQLTVLEGDCGDQSCVGGNIATDDNGHIIDCTSVQWFSQLYTNYTVFVHGFRQQKGEFDLELLSASVEV